MKEQHKNTLEMLLLNGTLWPGSGLKGTSYYKYKSNSNTSPPCHFCQYHISSLTPVEVRSKIQEIFLETGIEDRSKNLWFPAFGYVCKNLSSVLASKIEDSKVPEQDNISIAWIATHIYPNLEFLYASGLENLIHLIFTPKKIDLFSFTRKTIRENCFNIVIACIEKLSFAQSRSLQLTGKNSNSINIILRPPWEKDQHSASFIKYLIRPKTNTLSNHSTPFQPLNYIDWESEVIKIKSRTDLI